MGDSKRQFGCRIAELRCKEVISITSGNRLGYVSDVEIDICTGRVAAIVVPGKCGKGLFAKREDFVIPWDSIRRVGDDIILTGFCPKDCPQHNSLWQTEK